MIVYGDCDVEIAPADLISGLRRRFAARVATADEARHRLVLAGQLEQAAEDQGLDCAGLCRALTSLAAEDFIRRTRTGYGAVLLAPVMQQRLDAIGHSLASERKLRVRTPEGFAWYALLPDFYAQAAEEWGESAAGAESVLVVGIRSIGTTLSATVAQALALRGLQVQRVTVRPHGHPFQRRTNLPGSISPAQRAIIVDEGPGLSGSSMASVAEALVAYGFSRHALTFFPGHSHGPGIQASPAVRRWWIETPSRSVAWSELSMLGRGAPLAHEELARRLLGEPLQGPLVDVGAGKWRDHVDAAEEAAFAVAPFLEQPKLLARGRSGAALLFKFAGLAMAPVQKGCDLITLAEMQAQRLARLAGAGFTVPALANAGGWLVLPWVKGRRLRARDACHDLIVSLGKYIRAAADARLSPTESSAAWQRLRHVLVTNTEALLGEAATRLAARAADALAGEIIGCDLPASGDGRLAPHEWLRSGAAILKLDAGGHAHDHTAVGAQPVWWDIAGAGVEWNLDASGRELLARSAGVRLGACASYFAAGYAALRAGIAHLGATSASAGSGGAREYAAALAHYRCHLEHELSRLARVLR